MDTLYENMQELWQYLTEFFLCLKRASGKFAEKIKNMFYAEYILSHKLCYLRDKYTKMV